MHIHRTISEMIAAHCAAALADEAAFDASGSAHDACLAERTGAAEGSAFIELVSAPCLSPEEVQAKLRHFLDGSIGERGTHIECLIDYGDDLLERFLRSLAITDAGTTLTACSTASHAGTREEA